MIISKQKEASNYIRLQDVPNWAWFEATYFWEYGSTEVLAQLVLESEGNIPTKIKRFISDIVAGVRIPEKKKAAVKIIQNYRRSHSQPEQEPLTILRHRLTVLTTLFDHKNIVNEKKTRFTF